MTKEAAKLKLLVKADYRKQWKLLKTKHAKAITASGIDFDSGLGRALDKYQAAVDKLGKVAAKTELTRGIQVDPVLSAYRPLETLLNSYRLKVKNNTALPAAAKKDLSGFLSGIVADGSSWRGLAEALVAGKTTDDAAWSLAQEMTNIVDNLEEPVNTIVKHGAQAAKDAADNDSDALALQASRLHEAARLLSPAIHEIFASAKKLMKDGSNFALYRARATAMSKLATRLRKASVAFDQEAERAGIGGTAVKAIRAQHAEIVRNVEQIERRVQQMAE